MCKTIEAARLEDISQNSANIPPLSSAKTLSEIARMIVNGILKTQAKAYIKGTNNPFARFAADYGTNILSASFMDFNAFESVFGRVTTDWTPFSIGYSKRVLETWSNILSEDHTFMDCVITSSGAMRATKYLWEPFNK